MQTSPLERWDDLSRWASALDEGRGAWDIAAGATTRDGLELRGRVGYGLTKNIDFAAEGFVEDRPGSGVDAGVLAGISGRF